MFYSEEKQMELENRLDKILALMKDRTDFVSAKWLCERMSLEYNEKHRERVTSTLERLVVKHLCEMRFDYTKGKMKTFRLRPNATGVAHV